MPRQGEADNQCGDKIDETDHIKWQEYDPWDLSGRLDANMNMYDGPGGCSVFRTFQGWLGLSRHGPKEGELVEYKRRSCY
jgi:hypothetical protein